MEWILRKREFVQDKNVLYFSMDFQAFLVCLKQKQCHLLDTIHIVNNTFCSFPIYTLPNSGFKIVEMTVVLPGPAAQWAVVTGQHGGTVQSLLRAANQTAARRVSVYRLCNNNTHTHTAVNRAAVAPVHLWTFLSTMAAPSRVCIIGSGNWWVSGTLTWP